MTKPKDPVLLVGGPSAGKTFRPATKWPFYLDRDGEPVSSSIGHVVMAGKSQKHDGVYIQQKSLSVPGVTHYEWREALPYRVRAL